MCKAIGKFISFAVKLLLLVYILAWLDRVISGIVYKWRTRGVDSRIVCADEMEKYYMKYGVRCSSCLCWIPAEADVCPVCGAG